MKGSTVQKFEKIRSILEGKGVLVAFSGGVDSSVLAQAAKKYAERVVLLTVHSQTISRDELDIAKQVAKELDLEHEIVEVDWLAIEHLANNPKNRCYLCKKELAKMWKKFAQSKGLEIAIEGTNASDKSGFCPGAKALEEEGIVSPFLIADISKDEIREFARANGLSIADRPSMACLATRFPYGTEITGKMLKQLEAMEKEVRAHLGVDTIRVRYHGELVRIEVGREERTQTFDVDVLDKLQEIGVSHGFKYVTIDVYGYRTGAMDES